MSEYQHEKHALLLDTNLLIHEFKRQVSVLGEIPRPQRATSTVAVWEFVHLDDGRMIARAERMERKAWMDRLRSLSAGGGRW